MNRILLLLLCLSSFYCVEAKNRHYIYVFDCTQSMSTEFGIWENAKDWLKEDILRKREDAIISIIPFRDHSDGLIPPFERKEMDWNQLESRFNALISSAHSKTGICRAWDEAVKYIRPGFENWFILLTDGKDEYEGPAEVQRRMHEWCMYHEGCNAYVVTLSTTAKQALWTDLSNCDDIDIITVTEHVTDHIPVIGTFDNKIQSMLANSPRNIIANFSEDGLFKAHIECDDSYYNVSIKDNEIKDYQVCFIIKEKKPGVRPKDEHEIHFNVVSDDSGVRFRKSDFTVFVDTRDLANVDFAKASNEEYNGGSVNTYPKFLFWPGKDWEEAFIDLGAVFNQQAINKDARMHFSITMPIEIKDKCQVYLNGKEVGDSFDINSDNSKLSIRISHDAPEAGYTILMEGKGVNIESVNAELGDKYILELKVKHTTSWNPLKTILFWVAIIIVFLTLLMYVWRNILTRKIMDKQICLSPDYYNPIAEVSNCIKCILTNKKKTGRNGLIHRIYCGPIQYVNIPEAMSDIVLVTNYDDDIIVKANISYDIDDIPLTSNRNIQLNSKTEFVLRDKNASFTIIIS